MMSQHQAGIAYHLLLAKVTGALMPSDLQVLPEAADAGLLHGLHQAAGSYALAERESRT